METVIATREITTDMKKKLKRDYNRYEEETERYSDGYFMARFRKHIFSAILIVVLPQDGWYRRKWRRRRFHARRG